MKVLATACFLLLLLNGGRWWRDGVQQAPRRRRRRSSRRSPPRRRQVKDKKRSTHKLFVFGDEFVDVGNLASDDFMGGFSKTWRYPFGMSDAAHGRKLTGRFSDGLVQSDYMAKILGHRESPPAYNGDAVDPSGLNFAIGGAGVLQAPVADEAAAAGVTTLRDLIRDGVLDEDKDFKESVALVTFSGNDYGQVDDAGVSLKQEAEPSDQGED